MKLVVQIPCHNEEKTISSVIRSIPKKIKGIDSIEILVIDDGSSDKTPLVATLLKAKVYQMKRNEGLASAFQSGIRQSLKMGADIIVNTDGDNQYKSRDIPKLIRPILEEECDLVIADRQTHLISHFSLTKKVLQKLGSFVVRFLSGTEVSDAVSGFRAYSRSMAKFITLTSKFSHTIETIFIASRIEARIGEVKVFTNPKTRDSRLFKNIWVHVWKSGRNILWFWYLYRLTPLWNENILFSYQLGSKQNLP